MVRETSIEAYQKIKEEGLLSKRRLELYEYVFENGPCTARAAVKELSKKLGQEVAISFSSYAARFSELRDAGVFSEVGETIDTETKHKVILWDVTKNLPVKLNKPRRIDYRQILRDVYKNFPVTRAFIKEQVTASERP